MEGFLGHEVHSPPAEQPGEFVLDVDDAQARGSAGLELHQYVHVAVRPEVVAQDGPEERQAADMIPAADGYVRCGGGAAARD